MAKNSKRMADAKKALDAEKAYGLDEAQIKALAGNDSTSTLGQFELVSPVTGTVLQDDFRLGERVEAGRRLFLIADESRVWIQANLSPTPGPMHVVKGLQGNRSRNAGRKSLRPSQHGGADERYGDGGSQHYATELNCTLGAARQLCGLQANLDGRPA